MQSEFNVVTLYGKIRIAPKDVGTNFKFNYIMKADLIKNWLSSEGYRYETDADGDIHFKYQGKNMYFITDERDELYFRLMMPYVYEVENNREKVLEACNTICRELKVVKAFLVGDGMFLCIEMFVDSSPEVEDFLQRCCDILLAAYHKGAEEILG